MNKKLIGLAVLASLVAFAFGRYSAPTKVVTETKTVEVEKKTETKDTDTQQNVKRTIVRKKLPNGEEIEVEKDETVTKKEQEDKTTDNKQVTSDKTSETIRNASSTQLSVLGGYKGFDFTSPIIGGHISRSLVGPLTVGAWGLSNATYGLSVGLSF